MRNVKFYNNKLWREIDDELAWNIDEKRLRFLLTIDSKVLDSEDDQFEEKLARELTLNYEPDIYELFDLLDETMTIYLPITIKELL